ncbi:hypothetical protein ASPWEDRAFT_170489 [Aspergillus wentii DTO 134E9]|uniref:Uncharacterized protein n=1 Tax=Aspergillus wentii DTO 134E9 TaxID=1073089 RepID=A0A1L9RPX5_ASPWE|nr:uncharacterized protein ASPWEDRAFT_170489 [Aspergillus wentii DTO 134E9]KAI9923877.1 hypothetical protein MW887_008182 [Aspergillus wentii]OJJ36991.1 hypothetical protein ASPWEDRAFT_170489 [Aspergillus wentii DTO 134E9]
MVSFPLKAIGATVAAYLVAQQCQCPQVAIVPAIDAALQIGAAVGSAGASFGGAIVGAHFGNKERRGELLEIRGDFKAPPGVPQQEFDRCANDLSKESVKINVKGPVENHGVRAQGLPASCMNLATVIDGDASGGPRPTPCGSDCLLYNNLNKNEYEKMRKIWGEIQKK